MDTFNDTMTTTMPPNESISNDNSTIMGGRMGFDPHGYIRIPLYSIIFVLAITGNLLVIITLVQNKRMRTVTNMFLLNLAVSDMLLALFCMPFTLIPTLMQNFVFGEAVCIIIRFIQALSVGVSIFTFVVIALERYFAICSPLKSRRWQTIKHSYRTIGMIWVVAIVCMIPIAVTNKTVEIDPSVYKCIEIWGIEEWQTALEKAYTIFLDLVLFIIPLIVLLTAYGLITRILWAGIKLETKTNHEMKTIKTSSNDADDDDSDGTPNGRMLPDVAVRSGRGQHNMQRWNTEKSLASKRRAIKMLFAVVIEFFICWTPLYVVMTMMVFDRNYFRSRYDPVMFNLIHLLSFCNTCCNPITYCFMNAKFRQGFKNVFNFGLCTKKDGIRRNYSSYGQSHGSPRTMHTSMRTTNNDSTISSTTYVQ